MNLQNLPAGGDLGKLIKSCFAAAYGSIFCGADFASLEDRISALTTKDPEKLKVYTSGFDGHCLRAYTYFGDRMPDIDPTSVESINSIEDKYPQERQDSKAPTFALTYMGTWTTLVKNCGFSEAVAKHIETVYTAGKYLDRPETPVFIGGMTQYIEFDEVISKSAAETEYGKQPLGDIAAIGRGGKPVNNGHIHYQCEEPGYIMGLIAITPMIDYSQGNDFDLNLQTIDDLHKPALDGIGYQDLIKEQMVGETSTYKGGATISQMGHLAANKTVAWIDYMTNYNRTYGDFAAGEALDFMVLNRRYEVGNNNTIEDLTTYIDPQKYIEIFADTSIDSQNFWVQTVIQATRRGNYSAKQIPFLFCLLFS